MTITITVSDKSDPRNIKMFQNSDVPSHYRVKVKQGNKESYKDDTTVEAVKRRTK